METYTYTHYIDATHRLVASIDSSYYQIDDILGDTYNIFTTRCSDRLCPINTGNLKDELASVANRFDYNGSKEYEAHAVKLYLAIKGIAYKELSLRGYSQSEWHDVIIYNNNADEPSEWMHGEGMFDDLRAWYRGDIYCVESQQLETYINHRTDGILERWETIDSRYGVLLYNESNLALIASQCDMELTN